MSHTVWGAVERLEILPALQWCTQVSSYCLRPGSVISGDVIRHDVLK